MVPDVGVARRVASSNATAQAQNPNEAMSTTSLSSEFRLKGQRRPQLGERGSVPSTKRT